MKFEIQKKNGKAEISIELDFEDLGPYMKRAARRIGSHVDINGFRRGAAPFDVVERAVGIQKILEEAAPVAIRETYLRVALDQELETVGEPMIEIQKLAAGNPLEFKATSLLLPEVELGSYEKIPVSPENIVVTQEQIDKAVETLRKSRATSRHVEREAKKGDRVEIDFKTTKNGKPVEGGESLQHPLVLGEGHFMPGFEDELLGMKEGEVKKFSLTAPADYYHKDIAGADLEFEVTMKNIQELTLPAANDSFAASLGKFGSIEELRESIAEGISQERKERAKEKRRLEIVEYVVSRSKMEIPAELVDAETQKMERELLASLEQMNIKKESYLKHLGTTLEEMRKDWRPQAQSRVAAALVLRKIGQKEGVHVTKEEVDEKVQTMLQSVSSPDELGRIDTDALKDHARASLRNEKVFELLEKRVVEKK